MSTVLSTSQFNSIINFRYVQKYGHKTVYNHSLDSLRYFIRGKLQAILSDANNAWYHSPKEQLEILSYELYTTYSDVIQSYEVTCTGGYLRITVTDCQGTRYSKAILINCQEV